MSNQKRETPFVPKDEEKSIEGIISSVKKAQTTISQYPLSTRAQLAGVFDLSNRENQSDEG